MNTLHLFAGAGGGLYADLILGHQPIGAVEYDGYCCEVLRERSAEGWFPGLAVHQCDVREFDPSEYAGRVDCLSAGFPCQDISVAGSGRGIEGERSGLWSEVVRCAGALRPRYLFLENSPAITFRGLERVLGDLAGLGYDARWCVLSAAAVGATHLRARWFCLASDAQSVSEREPANQADSFANSWKARIESLRGRQSSADADRLRERQPQGGEPDQRRRLGNGGSADVGDTNRARLEVRESEPSDDGSQQPAAVGTGWWEFEPDVGRMAHGVANRVHRLRALGNGQVPIQVAMAWKILGGGE